MGKKAAKSITNQVEAPQSLFQLARMIVKGFIKKLPLTILIGVLAALVTYVWHTYLVVVLNNTISFRADKKILSQILLTAVWEPLTQRGARSRMSNLFWMLFNMILFGTISRIFSYGFKKFFIDIGGMYKRMYNSLFSRPSSSYAIVFIVGIGLGAFAGLKLFTVKVNDVPKNYFFISLLLSVIIFLSASAMERSMVMLVSKLAKSDIMKLFRSKNPGSFNYQNFSSFMGGLSTGLFVVSIFALIFNSVALITIFRIVVLCGLFAAMIMGMLKGKPATGVAASVIFMVCCFMLTGDTSVFADDGGWSESGGNFAGWFQNPGTPWALKGSIPPALSGLLGGLLSGLSNSLMSGLNALGIKGLPGMPGVAPGAVPPGSKPGLPGKTRGGKPLTPEQTAKIRQNKLDAIKAGVEAAQADAEAYNSFWGFMGNFFTNCGQDVSGLASDVYKGGRAVVNTAVDYTKSAANAAYETGQYIYNNPSQAFQNSWQYTKDTVTSMANTVKDMGNELILAGKDIMTYDGILTDTLKGMGTDISNFTSKTASAIYTAVTDPQKVWNFIKDSVGYDNFVKCMDPNLRLSERLWNYGVGVVKLYGTIQTAGTISTGIKAGVTKVAGFADDIARGLGVKGTGSGVTKTISGASRGLTHPIPGTNTVKLPHSNTPGKFVTSNLPPKTNVMTNNATRHVQNIADKHGVNIHVRPSNPASKPWIDSGKALPKPEFIKTNTVNDLDTLIGAPKNSQGLVGHYKPTLPPKNPGMSDKIYSDLTKQYNKRMQSYDDFQKYIAKNNLTTGSPPKITVRNGIVYDGKTGKPFAGDYDIFGITDPHGNPVSDAVKNQIIKDLKGGPFQAQHGAHIDWKPVTPDHVNTYNKIINSHGAGGEPLITFNPANQATSTVYQGPVIQ